MKFLLSKVDSYALCTNLFLCSIIEIVQNIKWLGNTQCIIVQYFRTSVQSHHTLNILCIHLGFCSPERCTSVLGNLIYSTSVTIQERKILKKRLSPDHKAISVSFSYFWCILFSLEYLTHSMTPNELFY